MTVPLSGTRDEPPPGRYELAWEYLRPDARLERITVSHDVSLSRVGSRITEVDLSLPTGSEHKGTWYVPLAYLPKDQVSPRLSVLDAAGREIAVPTKRENMALTSRALHSLADEGPFGFGATYNEALARQVVTGEVIESLNVVRMMLEPGPAPSPGLVELLVVLVDSFILWVPISGEPGSLHHCRIIRGAGRQVDPVLGTRRSHEYVEREFETAVGHATIRFRPVIAGLQVRWRAIPRRVLNLFALRAIEFQALDESGQRRAASYHLRVQAPEGFLVRHVRAAAFGPLPIDEGPLVEIENSSHVTVQGQNTDIAHVHLAERDNPPGLYLRATLGLHGGMTTLWTVAATLTAGMLWLVHHHPSFGPAKSENRQIVAAVLLVVPVFASAYSLRAEGNEVLRSVLAGARGLLLGSAALSVATALALASLTLPGVSRHDSIEAYATASYFVAVPILVAWVLSGRPTWLLFRQFLSTPEANLVAQLVIACCVLVVGVVTGLPVRVGGAVLLVLGLCLAADAGNSVAVALRHQSAPYKVSAGLGSILVLTVAGYFLGFFDGASTLHAARLICALGGLAMILVALGLGAFGAAAAAAAGAGE